MIEFDRTEESKSRGVTFCRKCLTKILPLIGCPENTHVFLHYFGSLPTPLDEPSRTIITSTAASAAAWLCHPTQQSAAGWQMRCPRTKDQTNEHAVLLHATAASIGSSDVTTQLLHVPLACQQARYARTRTESIRPSMWKLWRSVWQVVNVNFKHLRSDKVEVLINRSIHLRPRQVLR